MASLALVPGKTFISYAIVGLDSANYGTVWIQLLKDGRKIDEDETSASQSISGSFAGLLPQTTYQVYVYAEGKNGTSSWEDSKTETTTGEQTYAISVTVYFEDGSGDSCVPWSVESEPKTSTKTTDNVWVEIPDSTPEKSGYAFVHWQLKGYSQYTYSPGSRGEFTGDSTGQRTATLIAVWKKVNEITCTVHFDAGGGSGAPKDIPGKGFSEGDTGEVTINIPDAVPTKNGYEFINWKHSEYGTTYSAGKPAGFSASVWGTEHTLVAQWKRVRGGAIPYVWAYDAKLGKNRWHEATAYVWNGSEWKLADPYISNGSAWKPD